jgi:hypothetical protein
MTFEGFPKMARLTREVIVTEKIDGTNAQVFICDRPNMGGVYENFNDDEQALVIAQTDTLAIFAGSRTRYITPEADNFGFARWVKANADALFTLGPGRHFGEWWGQGIQRGYGLVEKRFSLFNTSRWSDEATRPACCGVVPVLYQGLMSPKVDEGPLARLRHEGSVAAPGFMQPEGIVVYHVAANVAFKKTLLKDEQPKGQQ